MNADAHKDDRLKQNLSIEVVNAEKQLWALIQSKGILHRDVQDWYKKARLDYENIILNNYEVVDLQDVEYSLWKLHYKHIDEFRKKIRQNSTNSDSTKAETPQDDVNLQISIDTHMEGFKSFLFEATEFYQNLIAKLKRSLGLPEELLLFKKDQYPFSVEPEKLHKSQSLCHRFLVCLGDLFRYIELCKKPTLRNHNWSVATRYYMEAARIWPFRGNPQNQLALLATYIGDDLLALYHCFRSLAIKEPFPDAWNNLLLLFEKNRSSHLPLLSRETCFDFLKPVESGSLCAKSYLSNGGSNKTKTEFTQHDSSWQTDFGPLFVRVTSFFFIPSSTEDFHCTFASTMRELEALMEVDIMKLRSSLEAYHHVDSVRKGPSRALQLVSILIFVIHRLLESPDMEQEQETDRKQFELTHLGLSTTFISMGRFSERCMKGNYKDACPLLPAVLVFVEWLVGMLNRIESYGSNEVRSAMSYFFGTFVDLLNRLGINDTEVKSPDQSALWEDYELRGFDPTSCTHTLLDFTSNSEHMENFESGSWPRIYRVFHAGLQIVERSCDSTKWMVYDKLGKCFYRADESNFKDQRKLTVKEPGSDLEANESCQHKCEPLKKDEKDNPKENQNLEGKSRMMEEEEVILFKPLMRYNSSPIYTESTSNTQVSKQGTDGQTEPSDEILRRVASLFVPQTEAQNGSFNLCSDISSFGYNKPFKQQEPLLKGSATYSTGPPSLSAWVLDRERSNIGAEKGSRDFLKHELSTIEELALGSLKDLSISDTTCTMGCSEQVTPVIPSFSPPYMVPLPSAPLLPENASWFRENASNFFDGKSIVGNKEADGLLGASPISRYSNWSAAHGPFNIISSGVSDFTAGYPPVPALSSSEWLHQYRNSHNWPVHLNSPGYFNVHDASRFNLFDMWGNPLVSSRMVYMENPQLLPGSSLVHVADEQRRDRLFPGYQKPFPSPYSYGCGSGTDGRTEQAPSSVSQRQ